MAVTVNTTDTFEQWRVKTNQIGSDLDSNISSVRADLVSNVSTINGSIASNVTTVRSDIASNVTIVNGSIASNVAAVRADITSNNASISITFNNNINANVLALNSSITSNVNGILANIASPTGNIISGNIVTSEMNVTTNFRNFTGANQSLGTNGYQKLPGGLIMQWGNVNVSPTLGGTTTVSFGVAFSSAVYSIVATPINITASLPGDKRDSWTVYSVTTSQFVLRSDVENMPDSPGLNYYWFAIGV